MNKMYSLIIGLFVSVFSINSAIPEGFVYLYDVDPTIIQSMRYASSENFLGCPVTGYNPDSKITKGILFMYSMETFLPYNLNKAEREMDASKV